MPLVPSSPDLPGRSRPNPPSIDLSSAHPAAFTTNGSGTQGSLYSPRTPRTTVPQSPITPQYRDSGPMDRSSRYSVDFTPDVDSGNGGVGGAGGLGSLADELANAWDDDGEGDGEDMSGMLEDGDHAHEPPSPESLRMRQGHDSMYAESIHESGMGMGSAQDDSDSERGGFQPSKAKRIQKAVGYQRHRRYESSLYDGSEYGNDSDFEEPGDIPPGLEARMAEIESLVRWIKSEGEGEGDDSIDRAIISLRDLGGQSGIESGATRLITAHASLTSHLAHQTRSLQTLTHPLLFSRFPILSSDTIDDLIPLIEDIIPNLPFPDPVHASVRQSNVPANTSPATTNPLHSLQALLSQTSDLTHTLRALSDTLHESRQLTSAASRRLKSVRDLLAEMRRDEETREEGTRWIETGGWDERLEGREAGKVCGEVVSGFEAVCGEWRDRLFGPEVAVA